MHPEADVFRETIAMLHSKHPRSFVLENVLGFMDMAPNQSKSALDLAIIKISEDYFVDAVVIETDL